MLFGKKRKGLPFLDDGGDGDASISPEVFEVLDRLQKSGTQLTVRFSRSEVYTSELLGLGKDGFFIDTFSPPQGDRHAKAGRLIELESIIEGISYVFRTTVMGKVRFLDDMPAFKLAYPQTLKQEARRKNNRHPTKGTSRISFIRPFACDAPVVDIGEGGFAFEYSAELGRLAHDTRLGGAMLEMGPHGVMEVKVEVVGSLVASLGGLSLPATYRTGVRFLSLSEFEKHKLGEYLKSLES